MSTPPERPQARIFALISQLLRRPGRSDRRLPLIWLSGSSRARALDALVERLKLPARYRVPHAHMDMTLNDAPSDIRQLLRAICLQLSAPLFGGQRLSFRHYELVDWLMGQDLSRHVPGDRSKLIVALLRERYQPFRRHHKGLENNELDLREIDLGPRYSILLWLVRRVMPEIIFRAAVSGAIPGFGARYRWFMRQQYLAPLQSVNFLGFAERLTEGVRQPEDIDQVDKLLVHAFLQDLRRAYARRLGRLEGWRRTAYPVVLINSAAEGSVGSRLMHLINDVRNETGRSDPLLVVCTDDQVPQTPTKESSVEFDLPLNGDPAYADEDYRKWAMKLPGGRRARVDTAWYLPIAVIASEASEQEPRRPIGATPAPWFARRSVVSAVIVILGLPVVGWVDWEYAGGAQCSHFPFLGQVNVRDVDGQCIGYSDSNYYRFNDQPGQERLRDVQNKIFEQNDEVRNLWESGGRLRPYVTIVYLAALTGRPAARNEEAYAAEREELEGLAIAQRNGINKSLSSSAAPLLNIVIANGGFQLQYASQAVDMIADLAAKDPTVVGVVGLGESRTSTAEALRRLNKVGLPLVAPVATADGFGDNSRLYLQLSAPNRDQVKLIGEYSKNVLNLADARVYWTVGRGSDLERDLYVKTYVEDLLSILPEKYGIGVENKGRFNGDINQDVCGYSGLLVFAGRWTEFGEFLDAINAACRNSSAPRYVMANDSVGRYMDNPTLRRSAPSTISVTYVSKSALGSCEDLKRAEGKKHSPSAEFLALIKTEGLLQPQRCGEESVPIGSRDSLGYDAAMIILRAVESLGQELRPSSDSRLEWNPRSIIPIAVHAKILEENHRNPFEGVSGRIEFDDSNDWGEPKNKRISLLRVEEIPDVREAPVELFHCGLAYPDYDPTCRQPSPGNANN